MAASFRTSTSWYRASVSKRWKRRCFITVGPASTQTRTISVITANGCTRCRPCSKMLAPADMALHSAVQRFHDEFNHGLRDLVDIDALLRHFGADPAFWPALIASAHTHQLLRPLFYAAFHSAKLLHTPVPPEFIAAVRAESGIGAADSRVMDWLLLRALRPDHPTCALPGTRIAYKALYLRAHWLRMPPLPLTRHLLHKAFISKSAH